MNKALVDSLLPEAIFALENKVVKENGKIDKGLRGQIASFGAAVSAGSLLAAAAFFNEQNNAETERHKLMEAINLMLERRKLVPKTGKTLFDTIHANQQDRTVKEKVLCCAVALKLAMNLFELTDGKKTKQSKGEEASS